MMFSLDKQRLNWNIYATVWYLFGVAPYFFSPVLSAGGASSLGS
jgi:hypothetical protein